MTCHFSYFLPLFLICIKIRAVNTSETTMSKSNSEATSTQKDRLTSFLLDKLLPSHQVKSCSLLFLKSQFSPEEEVEEDFDSRSLLKLMEDSYSDSQSVFLHPNSNVTIKLNSRLNPISSTKKFQGNCFLSLIHTKSETVNDSEMNRVFSVLTTPIEFPLTRRHEDFYVFITMSKGEKSVEKILLNDNFAFKFKYKLGIGIKSDSELILKSLCFYCDNGQPKIVDIDMNSKALALKLNERQFYTDFVKNLHGKSIRCSGTSAGTTVIIRKGADGNWKPFKTGGLFLRNFITASEFLNFTYTVFPSSGGGGSGMKLKNGTWNGVIGDILYQRADIGAATGLMKVRYNLVDLATPFSYQTLSFAHGPTEPIHTWKSVFWPFAPSMWVFVGICTAIALVFIEFFNQIEKRKINMYAEKSSRMWRFDTTLYVILSSYLLQTGYNPVSKSTKLFLVWWYMFIMIVTTVYLSLLFGFFVNPPCETPPGNFEELADAHKYKIQMTFFGGAIWNFFARAPEKSAYGRIFKRMEKSNTMDCHKTVLEEKSICIAYDVGTFAVTRMKLSDKFGRSQVVQAQSTAFEIPISLTTEKRSILLKSLSRVTSANFEGGFSNLWLHWSTNDLRMSVQQKLKKEHGGKIPKSLQIIIPDENEPIPLALHHVTGANTLLLGGLVVSTLAFIVEISKIVLKLLIKFKAKVQKKSNISYNNDTNEMTARLSIKPNLE